MNVMTEDRQLDLLASGSPRFPRARRSDPTSSHSAAAAAENSGQLAAQMALVKSAIRQFAGFTSRELAGKMHADRYMLARRLPELERLGLVRKGKIRICMAGGRPAITWWPT